MEYKNFKKKLKVKPEDLSVHRAIERSKDIRMGDKGIITWLRENYNFQANPFRIKPVLPDAALYVDAKERFTQIGRGMSNGIVVIIGSIGSGKSATLELLEKELSRPVVSFGRPPTLDELYISVRNIVIPRKEEQKKFLGIFSSGKNHGIENLFELRNFIMREKKDLMILIDNAHRMEQELTEELALFYDIPTVHIVVAGTPGILTKLEKYPSFRDRVSEIVKLEELGFEEIKKLVSSRISSVQGENPFSDEVIKVLHSMGSAPRHLITNVYKVLNFAYVNDRREITPGLVKEAISEKVKFESFTDNLSQKKREMVLTIYGEPNITATELSKKINSTKHSTLNMINELMNEKIVEESGKRGRARTFKIVDKYIRVLSEVVD
ncbi:hypothetical protein BEH94_04135 [Candidatus Altiarchaeales archaeon WOR_SM1_SCG]|nr:hypothetical protein BEH94_04135 [Candidatus Altiarchaeales archaeon WOR_SM1_SCG]